MRLVEIEDQIKDLIKEDINNPEIYRKIWDLVYFWLKRNKKMSYDNEAREVADIMAEDLYLKVYMGKPVYSWLGYIAISYISYIKMWRKENTTEIIDTRESPEIAETLIEMSSASNISSQKNYDLILSEVYINEISKVIDSVLEDSRVKPYTKDWLNSRITLLLSLGRGKFVPYRLSEGTSQYCRMLLVKIKDKIHKDLATTMKNYTSNMTPLQLFTLEGGISDE